ncbi:MAG: prepilin-type N-terminal cleavage/methylation domain-containing protein [Candidatus Omnitrophota bacterium]
MMKVEKGFTLMEILITMIIVAMLASVLLSRYYGQQERAIVAEAVTNLSAIRQNEVNYYLENSAYLDMDTTVSGDDTKWATIGLDKPDTSNFNYKCVSGVSTATRSGGGTCLSTSTHYGNCTVTLAVDGSWGGDHPYKPA